MKPNLENKKENATINGKTREFTDADYDKFLARYEAIKQAAIAQKNPISLPFSRKDLVSKGLQLAE